MIVYVESNFILEITLEQEQFRAANAILALAENGHLKLVFPNFVLGEPFERIIRERNERNLLHGSLLRSLTSLQRSEPHKDILLDMEPVVKILREAHFHQLARLHLVFEKLLTIGKCIEIEASIFKEALNYQKKLDLSPQDSIIYATILADLQRHPHDEEKCFLSRDRRAFDNEDDRSIKAELAAYKCRYIGSFMQGFDFILHTLQSAG